MHEEAQLNMDSALYTAAISGDIEVITLGGVGVKDQLTPTKNNVLHLASQSGKTQCVKEILRMHPSLLREVNSRDETALHLAAAGGHLDVVRALIDEAQRSSSVNIENLMGLANVDGDTALHEAVRYYHPYVVEVLVAEDPNDSHAANKFGETPIYLAAYKGYIGLVRLICAKCTSPTYNYSGPDGRTALHAAIIQSNSDECVKCLLEKKRDLIKIADKYGWTAFHYAAYYDHHIQIKNLVEVDKVVAYETEKTGNRTPLHVAAGRGSISVLQELSKLCPDLWDMIDKRGQNILHIAVTFKHKEIIEFILQNCPVIQSLLIRRDNEGNTPLHLLANSDFYVPELIQHELADREALNNNNLNPLDVAYGDEEEILMEQSKVRQALRDAGVKKTWKLWGYIQYGEVDRKKILANKAAAEKAAAEKKAKKAEKTAAKKAEKAEKTAAKKAEKAEKTAAEEKNIKELMIYFHTHMLVAALIATVTFTSGFTLPGGFDGNEGPNQGMATLTTKAAFKVFMLTDAIGLLVSVTCLILYFVAAMLKDSKKIRDLVAVAAMLNIAAIVAMMIAFITGTFAVLTHSSVLAISVCLIGCSFFLILFIVLTKYKYEKDQELATQTSRGNPA